MGESDVFESTSVINHSFTNPFNPSRKIHWVICPSHQVHMCVRARVCVRVCMCVYGTLACTRDLFSNIIHVDNALFLQLKNMINALFSSQHGGAKCFQFEGVEFGWQAIIDMYHHECQRRSNGLARMVPHLREIPVLRDAWTKLNVHPAKIMQVCFSQQFHACILHVCTSA